MSNLNLFFSHRLCFLGEIRLICVIISAINVSIYIYIYICISAFEFQKMQYWRASTISAHILLVHGHKFICWAYNNAFCVLAFGASVSWEWFTSALADTIYYIIWATLMISMNTLLFISLTLLICAGNLHVGKRSLLRGQWEGIGALVMLYELVCIIVITQQ